MAKLLTPLNLGALALSHRVVVLRSATPGHRVASAPWQQVPSGGLLVQELPRPGDAAEAWLTDTKACRRMIARLRARGALCIAQVGASEIANVAWARDSGFDGLELDAMGMGPADFSTLEAAVHAVLEMWGPDRVGIRISPFAWLATREDSTAAGSWAGLFCTLAGLELAYVHVAGTFTRERGDFTTSALGHHLRGVFHGLLMASGAYTLDAAVAVVEARWADAVGFDLIVGRGNDLVASVAASVLAGSASQTGRGA